MIVIGILGLWGEIRKWDDGTTIVQKTHDASKHHVLKVYFEHSINETIIIFVVGQVLNYVSYDD